MHAGTRAETQSTRTRAGFGKHASRFLTETEGVISKVDEGKQAGKDWGNPTPQEQIPNLSIAQIVQSITYYTCGKPGILLRQKPHQPGFNLRIERE
jgi:hypothetical protein